MSDWQTCAVSDSFLKNRVSRKNQILAKDIADVGRFPVIDQGQEIVAGYCDDENKVISFDLPLIVFGDHTRCFKFINFPFVLGADGTKVLIPNKQLYDPKFYYFALLALELPSRGYNRHFKMLKERSLPLPLLPEQKKIAHILSMVQRAIEAQERIIQTTTELKKALMHKLFTKGLRNEPQKQSEIGPVPKSWDVVRCEDLCETTSVGIVVKPTQYYVVTGVPALRSQNVRVDRLQMEPMVYISEEANDGQVSKSKLRTGDVLIVRTGANLGMSCVLPAELDGCNCVDLLFIRTKPDQLNGKFLSRFINSEEAKKQVGAGKTGMAQPHFNVGTVKRIFVPLPPLDEQNEIVACFEKIDQKYEFTESKRKVLQDLFRTLLRELMTARTRVHNLELSSSTANSPNKERNAT